jgi:WD40 repeat protein
VALSPDATLIAEATPNKPGEVTLWRRTAEGLTQETSFVAHQESVDRLIFSEDGTRLITGCAEGTALVWDVKALRARRK